MITTHNLRTSRYILRGGDSNELSRERLMIEASSAYADRAYDGTSHRYAFFPTDTVIEALRETGWAPVIAQEQRSRQEDRFGYQKHMVRFHRREELGRASLHDIRPLSRRRHRLVVPSACASAVPSRPDVEAGSCRYPEA